MIYKEQFKIGLNDIGKKNKIRNRAILEILENIGGYHSDTLKHGVNDMNTTGIAWILLDWKLEVLNRPTYGQPLTVNTWSRGGSKFFSYRDYEIYDGQGNLCVIATSKWTLMNLKERKMEKITEELQKLYGPEEKRVFSEEKLDKLTIPNEFILKTNYEVKRRDLDVNHHMHNLYYLDLAYEALPEEVYANRPFDHIRITYKKEIVMGDKICCKYTKNEEKHIVVIESEDGNKMYSIIEIY